MKPLTKILFTGLLAGTFIVGPCVRDLFSYAIPLPKGYELSDKSYKFKYGGKRYSATSISNRTKKRTGWYIYNITDKDPIGDEPHERELYGKLALRAEVTDLDERTPDYGEGIKETISDFKKVLASEIPQTYLRQASKLEGALVGKLLGGAGHLSKAAQIDVIRECVEEQTRDIIKGFFKDTDLKDLKPWTLEEKLKEKLKHNVYVQLVKSIRQLNKAENLLRNHGKSWSYDEAKEFSENLITGYSVGIGYNNMLWDIENNVDWIDIGRTISVNFSRGAGVPLSALESIFGREDIKDAFNNLESRIVAERKKLFEHFESRYNLGDPKSNASAILASSWTYPARESRKVAKTKDRKIKTERSKRAYTSEADALRHVLDDKWFVIPKGENGIEKFLYKQIRCLLKHTGGINQLDRTCWRGCLSESALDYWPNYATTAKDKSFKKAEILRLKMEQYIRKYDKPIYLKLSGIDVDYRNEDKVRVSYEIYLNEEPIPFFANFQLGLDFGGKISSGEEYVLIKKRNRWKIDKVIRNFLHLQDAMKIY